MRALAPAETGARTLDAAAVPLQALNVIEANAGTGKTWTITALYVRLLVEAEYPVDAILVVTFTEAATGELRDRIRRRLAKAREAFERGTADEDDVFMNVLLKRIHRRDDAVLRLTAALRDFDQAPIYTIHAFCQRVLGDRAFESAMPFRTDIVPDQSAFLREIVEDFWRNEAYAATPLYARYLIGQGIAPEILARDVERYLGKPYLEVRAPTAPRGIDALESSYARACAAARTIWLEERAAITAKLLESSSLNQNSYRAASIPLWLDEMHACLAPESPQLQLCEKFDKFTPEALAKGTKKNMAPPAHPFFDACRTLKAAHAALVGAYERSVILMKVRLLEFCNAELASRKTRRQLQSYDDLLLNLHRALHDEEKGASLAAALRARYQAALIDEFQDTDPVQYAIFRRIYGETAQPVFLVGDPKQSIYGFRGADVFEYLDARRQAHAAHTLTVNWRSEPHLLTAVNHLFQSVEDPFVIGGIPFTASHAAPGDRGCLVIDGDEGAPFEVWLVENADGKPVNKAAAAERAAEATASEIARLLALSERGAARIVEHGQPRRLKGGDIAVLARTHRQASAVRDALARLGVASVQRGAQSVFSTREAEELERVLAAIAEPGREALIGAALTTEMIGGTGNELHALHGEEARWEQIVERFRVAHRDWHELGFMPMLRALLKDYAVIPRLLGYADGERRATNLLHLAELIHCDADRQGIAGSLAWLTAKRDAPAEGNEAELLRLESDENLVTLLTVHAAKGLEFPLVFCPFVWDGNLRSAKAEILAFHDPERGHEPVVDFGSETRDASREQAMREERAESLRLLYVALTRAKYRCWMVWGDINDIGRSAPAWLLRAGLPPLVARAGGAIRVSPLPAPLAERIETAAAGGPLAGARRFGGSLRDTGYVTSFTALAHGRTVEAPDYDAGDRDPLPESVSGGDIFAFPRGAQAGKCLHAIFEQVDFAALERRDLERVVAKELGAHGFDAVWLPAIANMVESVLDTPLDESGMRLRGVTRARRLDELEFYYPIAGVSDTTLRRLLMSGGFPREIRDRIGALTFSPTQGYMRGFIDLVFEHQGRYYLADYKSNWLGSTVGAYEKPDLARAMGREAYYLQYLVYCIALHRYLATRLPGYEYDSHFGGVRYLFVRGMRPAAGCHCGVYADRPGLTLLAALDEYLRTGSA